MNEHMYIITHPSSIKSVVESCNDNDIHGTRRDTQIADQEDLPLFTNLGHSVQQILESGVSGRFVMECDDLTSEMKQYMESSGEDPHVIVKHNLTTSFKATHVNPPPSMPDRPSKPLVKNYNRHSTAGR